MSLLNSYVIRFHASGMNGTESFHITAESLEEAKRMWEDYVEENPREGYFYKIAEKQVKYHTGGYITWKEEGDPKELPCIEALPYDEWRAGSDHLWD